MAQENIDFLYANLYLCFASIIMGFMPEYSFAILLRNYSIFHFLV